MLGWPRSGANPEPENLPTPSASADSDPMLYQSELSRALLAAQDRDRQRIAADLHDSIGQNLSAVKMTIETVLRDMVRPSRKERQQRALTAALSRLHITVDELRRIALDLRPSMLEELGLLLTLDWCCREFAENNPELSLVKLVELAEKDVPPSLHCDIYRVIQEALHNVTKHALADNVEIVLRRDASNLVLTISDDGCGFEPQGEGGAGLGLYSMQARSERGGGSIHIDSAIDAGTRIVCRWPLPQDSDVEARDGAVAAPLQVFSERRTKERRSQMK